MKTVPFRQVGDVIAGQHIEAALYDESGVGSPYVTGPADFGDIRPTISKWTAHPKVFAFETDVLVTVKGNGVGKCNLGVDAAIGRQLMALRPARGLLDQRFLFYFLCSRERQLANLGQGATVPGIGKPVILNFEIPLLPLSEQQRIAAILDKADALRRKRQQALQLTDQFLRSTFLDMFGDPRHTKYPVASLDEVCTKITDGTHFTPTYVGAGVPFLRVTDIQERQVLWDSVKFIPEAEHDQLTRRCKPEFGDVLYSKNGTIGIPKLVDWDRPFSIFVSIALLKPDRNKLLGGFLESFLQTPDALRQATSHSKTLTVTNLHIVEIKKIEIPLPPLKEQREWLRLQADFVARRNRVAESGKLVDALFRALVQRAFRGEL